MPRVKFLKTIGLIAACFLALSAIGPLARAQEDLPLDPAYLAMIAEASGRDVDELAELTIDQLLQIAQEFLSEEDFIDLKLGLWGVDEERAQEIADALGLSLYEMCKKTRDELFIMATDKGFTDMADEINDWGADSIVITGDDADSDRVINLWFHNIFTKYGVQINKITIQKVTTITDGTYKYQVWDPDLNDGEGGYKTEEGEGINTNTQYSITYYTWDGALKEVAKQTVSDSKSYKREEDGSLTLHVHSVQNTTQVSQYQDGALVGGTTSGTYKTYQNMLRNPEDEGSDPEMLKVSEGTISGQSHVLYNQLTPTWMRQEGWTYRYDADHPAGEKDMATLNYTWYKYTTITLQDGSTKIVNDGTISYSFSLQWSEFEGQYNSDWDRIVTFNGPDVATGEAAGVLGAVWLDYMNTLENNITRPPSGTFDFSFTIIRTELTYGGYDENGNATSIHQHQDGVMYSPNQGDASWQHLVNYWYVPGSDPLHIAEDGGCWTNQAWGTNFDPSIVADKEPPADAVYSTDNIFDDDPYDGQEGYYSWSDLWPLLVGANGEGGIRSYGGSLLGMKIDRTALYMLLVGHTERWDSWATNAFFRKFEISVLIEADNEKAQELGLQGGYYTIVDMVADENAEGGWSVKLVNSSTGETAWVDLNDLIEAFGGVANITYHPDDWYHD